MRVCVERLGETKVQHLHGPVLAHLDVRGFQVAVNDTRFVSSLQRLSNLLGDWESFIDSDRPLRYPVGEGWPFHQLQHQRTGAVAFFKAMNGGDVRVVQAGKHLRFSLKPSQAIRISGKGLGQDLERHLAIQLGISGLIDLAHATLADEGGHVVVAESGADGKGHGL